MKGVFTNGLKNRKGQSAIEFMVVLLVLLFFLLFFLSLAMVLVVSDYVEYATFMSARTYKSMTASQDAQQRAARTVFSSYTDRIQGIARAFNLTFVDGTGTSSLSPTQAGVRATYTMDLFFLPPLFVPSKIESAETFASEVRLGRDPAYDECQRYFQEFSQRVGIGLDNRFLSMMDDNGC